MLDDWEKVKKRKKIIKDGGKIDDKNDWKKKNVYIYKIEGNDCKRAMMTKTMMIETCEGILLTRKVNSLWVGGGDFGENSKVNMRMGL